MAHITSKTEFVVKPVPSGAGASEFRQSMTPHPLVHQELPHDPYFGVYNRRLRSLEYGNMRAEDLYWRLRRQVGLAHTGELATEIRGPEAVALLNRVFTRDVSRLRVGRCSYQIACLADGGMLMDGILLRLECVDGQARAGEICELPLYDRGGEHRTAVRLRSQLQHG